MRFDENGESHALLHVDPLLALEIRAFLLDAVLLVASLTCAIWTMVTLNLVQWHLETALIGAALVVAWLLSIVARGGYEARYLGVGSEEFKRMLTAAMALLGAITMVAYFTPIDPPLRVVVPTLALGLVMLLGGRWRLRVWLGRQRRKGRFLCKTLLVGERLRHASLAEAFAGDVTSGFKAIGAVQPPTRGAGVGDIEDWLDNVMSWIAEHDVQAVAVVESATVDVEVLRRLAWRLEAPRIDLLVSPMLLSDVAGPRVSVRPAAGLPLIHLDEPTLTGPKRVLKRMLDLVLTIPALILLSPLFALIALAIRLDSPGRVFYVSERVGRSGVPFGCLKFRTMCMGADCMRGRSSACRTTTS